jgi:hypothetical protein
MKGERHIEKACTRKERRKEWEERSSDLGVGGMHCLAFARSFVLLRGRRR